MSIIITKIPTGCGKVNPTLRFLEEMREPHSKLYVITRDEVESLDVSRILKDFSPENSKRNLRGFCAQWHFVVAGYDEEPEELYEIPAVRLFLSTVTTVWPAWPFGASTSSLALWAVALSVIPSLEVQKANGEVQICFDNSQIVSLFNHCLPAFTLLSKKAGLSKHKGFKNLQRVATYLGIADQ
jgi:hypothetical protein